MDEKIIKQGLDDIATRDKDVAEAVALLGYPAPRIRPAGYETLFNIIVSQQLSTHAAAAIMGRVRDLLPEISAEAIINLPVEALRNCGLSQRKVEYANGLSNAIMSGSLDPDALHNMDSEDVIKRITALKGFGPWSAEIYLMFSLQRPDIFPSGDLALLVSLQKLKGLKDKPTPKEAQGIIAHWTPWRSVGSLFLWHYYHGAPT